jgi:UTP:GlnB (protein PII) uridylyltransferase
LFNDLEIQLHDAKITTIGSRVEDMFYVSDMQFRPITDEKILQKIKSEILMTVQAE